LTLRTISTRFLFGSEPLVLNLANNHNSSDRYTKSTPSSFNALRLLVNTGFQVLFHSPPGVLFTFPSQYWYSIGHQKCLGLEGGPPNFQQGFSCPVVLWCYLCFPPFAYATFTLFGLGFPTAHSARLPDQITVVRNPAIPQYHGLASSAFARHY
jgi:hypothetical protein